MKRDFQKSLNVSQSFTLGLEFIQSLSEELEDFHKFTEKVVDDNVSSVHSEQLMVRLDLLQESIDHGSTYLIDMVSIRLEDFRDHVHLIEEQLKKLEAWRIAENKMLSSAYQEELSIAKLVLEKSIIEYKEALNDVGADIERKINLNAENANNVQLKWMVVNVVVEVMAIAMFILVSIYLYRAVMIPIRDLKINTLKLSRGDLNFSDVNVNIKRYDEIGALSYAFNVMAQDLEKAVQENQKLIIAETMAEEEKQRSDQLEQLNNDLIEADQRIQETMFQLEASLGKEKELGQMKSRFVAIASHQFRTPLAIIQANAELVKIICSNIEPKMRDRLNVSVSRIEKEISRMTSLMNDVLIFGKVSSGQTELKTEQVDISTMCNTIIDSFNEIQADGRKMNVRVIGELKSVEVDKKMFRHVIDNLISNAFKYSAKDDPKCEISYLPKEVKISVSDTGIGIPDSELDGLFEPFHRADNVGDISGTGLGLSIAKEYIELNGGKISVHSRENEGSKFTVSIPYGG
jgi:signal transduction histidine kinase